MCTLVTTNIFVAYNEATLKKRRTRLDGQAEMYMVELMTLLTNTELTLAPQKRLLHEDEQPTEPPRSCRDCGSENDGLERHLNDAEKNLLVDDTSKDGADVLCGCDESKKEPSCKRYERTFEEQNADATHTLRVATHSAAAHTTCVSTHMANRH